jgi:hypothetical protein
VPCQLNGAWVNFSENYIYFAPENCFMKSFSCLVLLFARILLFAAPITAPLQTRASESTSTIVATIYLQVSKGINVYTADSAGKVSLVKGSPFPIEGLLNAVNGKDLISVGAAAVLSYPINATTGAVGKLASIVGTDSYAGGECGYTGTDGNPNGTTLDRNGHFFYVQLWTGQNPANCSAWQSYSIGSDGHFTYLDTIYNGTYSNGWAVPAGNQPTFSSSNDFFFTNLDYGEGVTGFQGLQKLSNGKLQVNSSFTDYPPVGDPIGPYYPTSFLQADNAGHLAVAMIPSDEATQKFGPIQLASFTIAPKGYVYSTNYWLSMPTPVIQEGMAGMAFSTNGKLLAVYGYPGVQLFHFNGAKPITKYTSLLPQEVIDRIGWDTAGHLYAVSYDSELIYVYNVTNSKVTELAGVPFKVPLFFGHKEMVVVPK